MRRVHWPQTAKHDRLIVRERQGLTQATIRVILDTAAEIHHGADEGSSLEWAIRAAASACEGLHSRGVLVELRIGDKTLKARDGARALTPLLDALAQLVPENTPGKVDCLRRGMGPRTAHELELVMTTDRGLPRWRSPRRADACRRFVVVDTACLTEAHHQINQQWEALCHETWLAQQ
jgi:uncharacterized protein (DUF58 family)